ncbi:MAG: ACT domain-containing protein [Bdellovibrionales bacterium]
MGLTLRVYEEPISLCQLPSDVAAPASILTQPFTYFFRTRDEATLICPTALVPENVKTEHGFLAIEFVGPFDFALTGILTQVANPLADAGVSIVALSTFTTDYILIKAAHCDTALTAIRRAGHTVLEAA